MGSHSQLSRLRGRAIVGFLYHNSPGRQKPSGHRPRSHGEAGTACGGVTMTASTSGCVRPGRSLLHPRGAGSVLRARVALGGSLGGLLPPLSSSETPSPQSVGGRGRRGGTSGLLTRRVSEASEEAQRQRGPWTLDPSQEPGGHQAPGPTSRGPAGSLAPLPEPAGLPVTTSAPGRARSLHALPWGLDA